MTRWLKTISALWLLICMPATKGLAAELTVDFPEGPVEVQLSGRIVPGDANALLQIIRKGKSGPRTLILDSPGGSILEALRIAQIVEKAAMDTTVASGRTCSSACFFVYLAGTSRQASSREQMEDAKLQADLQQVGAKPPGYLGIHRPYEPMMQSAENGQSALMRAVTSYLDGKLLPRRLIDTMMSRPSNDIYWLSQEDLRDIGFYPAHIEEYLIQKCSYDRNSGDKEMDAIQAGATLKVTELKAEAARSNECQWSELGKLADKGLLAIRRGWKPPLPK